MGTLKAKTKFKWFAFVLITMFVAVLFLFPSNVHKIIPGEPTVEVVGRGNSPDTSNIRELVGISHNVFIGKVIEQVGTRFRSNEAKPQTQFSVEVLENIKGDLSQKVKVNQHGGYKWNKLILVENDKLLEKGKTYLLATRYSESENWHTVIPVDGHVQISDEDDQTELVENYLKTYKEEISYGK